MSQKPVTLKPRSEQSCGNALALHSLCSNRSQGNVYVQERTRLHGFRPILYSSINMVMIKKKQLDHKMVGTSSCYKLMMNRIYCYALHDIFGILGAPELQWCCFKALKTALTNLCVINFPLHLKVKTLSNDETSNKHYLQSSMFKEQFPI